jgi:hypothetical protein
MSDLRYMTQAQADELANHYLALYADKFLGIRRLEVYPPLDDRLWDVVLQLRLQDHVRVLRRTVTNTLDLEVLVEGIRYQITPSGADRDAEGRHLGNWVVSFTTSDAVSMVGSQGVRAKHLERREAIA